MAIRSRIGLIIDHDVKREVANEHPGKSFSVFAPSVVPSGRKFDTLTRLRSQPE